MKKLLALLLAAVMLLALSACGKKAEEPSPTDGTPDEVLSVAETFLRAYYLRDYATKFSMYLYDARKQWEDEAIKSLGSAENFFATAQKQANEKGIEATVDSFDSYYAAYHRFILADCEEQYGEYTVATTATASVKMSAELLPQFRENLLAGPSKDYMDADVLNSINEVYTVTVNIVIDGEKKDYNENYLVYVVRYNNQWLVADHSM